MSDEGKQAWMKVGMHFAAVGDKLKEHGKRAAGESSASKPDDVDQAAVDRRAEHARSGHRPGGVVGERRGEGPRGA